MKTLKLFLALTLTTVCVGSAFADTIDFRGSDVTLGHSQVYNPGPTSVTAYAFGGSGLLYAKNDGGSEHGIGIARNNDNEITNTTFIQLDLANITGLYSLLIGSTQNVEGFNVCTSNELGTLGSSCRDFAIPQSDPFATPAFVKGARYVSIQTDRPGSTVLLDGLTTTNPVPEPSAFVLLGSGLLAGAGMIRRKLAL